MHTADVWSGQGHMKAKTLNKVCSSSPSAAWTGLTPARTSTNSEMQQPAHIRSSEDHQTFCEDCSVPPLLSFMFINGFTHSQDGKSTITSSQFADKFKLRVVGLSSPSGHFDR
ncbi:hypothetical protein E3U43_006809 [Larimichthys crocea]|uniref:Uncharacterized protein n=1 Tax=Larimichthys crocea TaxID=215358 RepID=A0ACD3RL36_LARCR|nr:hypothetical protein E3U43_006809 [Larimichthys crocea]